MKVKNYIKSLFEDIRLSYCVIALIGSAILAFGLYNIHSISGVTEGGVFGLVLLLEYWFDISPSISGFILNIAFYILGWKLLGKNFIVYSLISTAGFSGFYAICEQFPRVYPPIANMPLLASLIGSVFIGVGAGLCVAIGGAPSGDDALAMSLSKISHIEIQWVYLLSDFVVLVLSLSYIPLKRIMYSFLTVILSGQILGVIVKLKFRRKD